MFYFHNILGNTSLINNLRKSVENNTLSHSYLFLGNEGVGRKTLVNTLVKYLLCDNRINENGNENLKEPCGRCKSCLTFENNNHPDVVYIGEETIHNKEYNKEDSKENNKKNNKKIKEKKEKNEKKEKKTKSIGVDEIRDNILDTINYKPFYSNKKIYIINNGDDITVEAQNTILKTLEEPPDYVVFFIIAKKKESFLTTILSRVIEITVPPISEKLVKEYILDYKNNLPFDNERKDIDENFISVYSQGSIGKGISLIEDRDFYEMRENIIQDLCQLPNMSLWQTMLLSKKWDTEHKNYDQFFNILEVWFRDLIVMAQTENEDLIIQKDKKQEIINLVYREIKYDFGAMYKCVLDAKKSIKFNGNFRLTIEAMLIYIKEKEKND